MLDFESYLTLVYFCRETIVEVKLCELETSNDNFIEKFKELLVAVRDHMIGQSQ